MQSDPEHAPIAVNTEKGQRTFISTQPIQYLSFSQFTFTLDIRGRAGLTKYQFRLMKCHSHRL